MSNTQVKERKRTVVYQPEQHRHHNQTKTAGGHPTLYVIIVGVNKNARTGHYTYSVYQHLYGDISVIPEMARSIIFDSSCHFTRSSVRRIIHREHKMGIYNTHTIKTIDEFVALAKKNGTLK